MTLYDRRWAASPAVRPPHRVAGRRLPAAARLVAAAQARHAGAGRGHAGRQLRAHPHPGRRVRAQGRPLGNADQLLHAGGLVARGDRAARQVDAALREFPEVRYTVATINSGGSRARIYAAVYVRLVDRKEPQRSIDQLTVPLPRPAARIPGITVTNIGPTDRRAATRACSSPSRARPTSWRGCRADHRQAAPHPRPGRPGQHAQGPTSRPCPSRCARRGRRPG